MPEISPARFMTQAGWDDVPHLDEDTKTKLLASTPPHLRDARSKGIPSLGSGAIYDIPLEDVLIKPFAIPAHWKRAFAFDVGWNKTAAVWGAWDPTDGTCYIYTEHYRGKALPLIHATAIKARGEWIRGAIDPAARGRSQTDGEQLFKTYKSLGLKISLADNAVEAGIYEVWSALSTGRLRFFTTLGSLQAEYSLYRRDENGKIIKKFDHLMDALRYLMMSGPKIASVLPRVTGMTGSTSISDTMAGY